MNVDNPVRFVDQRLGAARFVRAAMRYVFPDHWSFMLGEIALYCFVILIATGTYLAFFFEPSLARSTYEGSYEPLRGTVVSDAYRSVVHLSLDVPGGLLIRQTHHWAANIFIVAIILHLLRVFFTGAFRKPRELNWTLGLVLLTLGLLEGFAGYSLVDDLLSGMGLAIGYSTAMSIPLVGGDLAFLIWDGEFPGGPGFQPRLYIAHVFIFPVLIAVVLTAHLFLIARLRHSQFSGRGRTEQNDVGTPLWPGYTLRTLGLLLMLSGLLFLLGGLVQINPIWQWGPYEIWQGENGAQPDWYLGWLIGGIRLMVGWEPVIGGYTIAPNPFFGGLLVPGLLFTAMFAWPWIEQRFITRDFSRHELLDRPRDNPFRTAVGVGTFTFVFAIFAFGAADRILVSAGYSYATQLYISRAGIFVAPIVAFFVTYMVCRRLRESRVHPLRGWSGAVVRRTPDGAYEDVSEGGP